MKNSSVVEYFGNQELLTREVVGFIASRYIRPLSVLPTLEWAVKISANDNISVMSNFLSPQERDVLKFLQDGKCGVILVLGRKPYKKLPNVYKQLHADNRLLIVSISNAERQSVLTLPSQLNYICSNSCKTYFPSIPKENTNTYAVFSQLNEKKRETII